MLAWSRMWAGFNLEGFWGEASHQKISRRPEMFVKHTVLGMFLPSLASQTYFYKRKEGSGELHIQAMSHRNAISKMTYPDFKEYTVWCGRMCHVACIHSSPDLSLFRKWVWVARLVFTFRIAISEDLIFPEKHAQTSQEIIDFIQLPLKLKILDRTLVVESYLMHVVPYITYRYKPPIRFLQHTIVSRFRPHKCQISEITISLRPNSALRRPQSSH